MVAGTSNCITFRGKQKVNMGRNDRQQRNKPDFDPPIPFNPLPEKEAEGNSSNKPLLIKLTTNKEGIALTAPTTEALEHYQNGTVEQFFKWVANVERIHKHLPVWDKVDNILKVLHGSDHDFWQRV